MWAGVRSFFALSSIPVRSPLLNKILSWLRDVLVNIFQSLVSLIRSSPAIVEFDPNLTMKVMAAVPAIRRKSSAVLDGVKLMLAFCNLVVLLIGFQHAGPQAQGQSPRWIVQLLQFANLMVHYFTMVAARRNGDYRLMFASAFVVGMQLAGYLLRLVSRVSRSQPVKQLSIQLEVLYTLVNTYFFGVRAATYLSNYVIIPLWNANK